MVRMGKLTFGPLRDAWKHEAADFTQLLAEELDQLGAVVGVQLELEGTEVRTTGGRRIDIVAHGSDDTKVVIENQYGRADHDHLTRGLAYAVAQEAQSLIIVAEEHREEFRAVADYLNETARTAERGKGVSVWLVEAKAVRVDQSDWAPLFTVVTSPNAFLAEVAAESSDPWNERDWHVNVGDQDPTFRSWNDYVEHGFMSSGGGSQWSRVLRQIPEKAWVFAYRSRHGYVGVGEVVSTAVRFDQATETVTGNSLPLREIQSLEGIYQHTVDAPDSDETADYVVGIRWLSDPKAPPVKVGTVYRGTAGRIYNRAMAEDVATKLGVPRDRLS